MTEEMDLLPCPFCGSNEIMLFCDPDEGRDNSGPSRRIQCAGCNIEAPFYDTEIESVEAWNRRTHAKPTGSAVEAQREALKDAWSRFCDTNPDDLTSPEELPDHALMTCEQFVEYALEALHPASEAQGGCITASAIEKAFSDPIEIWPTGWRETYPALAAPDARTIKTRLLALLPVAPSQKGPVT